MSESKQRKIHVPAYKAKVVLEAVLGVKTISEIAHEYGVHPVQVPELENTVRDHINQ